MGQLKSKQLLNNTMKVFIAISALIATALAAPAGPPAPYHPAPAPYHAPAPAPYHAPAPAYHPAKPVAYDETPKPYAFQYGVADDYSGANFKAAETADGKAVSGSYQVNLPDGRVQTVTYTADHYNGFVADVSYEGVPHYPEAKAYKPHPQLQCTTQPQHHITLKTEHIDSRINQTIYSKDTCVDCEEKIKLRNEVFGLIVV